MKSALSTFFKFFFAAAIIAWLIHSGKLDLASLVQLLKPTTIVIGFALAVTNLILCNERWRQLLQAQNIHLSRMNAWRLTTIGTFFNFVVPGGVGGDVIKSFYIARENPSHRMASVVTVAMDRLIGLFTMVLMALAVMACNWEKVAPHAELLYTFYFLLLIGIAFCFFWAITFSRRFSTTSGLFNWIEKILNKLPHGHRLFNMLKALSAYSENKKIFFRILLISFLAQCFSVSLFVFIGNALGYSEVPFSVYFFVVPIGFMVTAIPISPAGVGIGQAAFYYLFNLAMGTKTSMGTTAVTAFQCLQFLVGLFGAWYYITMRKQLSSRTDAEFSQDRRTL
jgi:uncharacterized protein (TIRG00374 family)